MSQIDLSVKLLLTIDECAAYLSLGRSQVYALVTAGKIPSVKIGRSRRVPFSGLQDFVEKLQVECQEVIW